jgi:DNA polymerase (family X)
MRKEIPAGVLDMSTIPGLRADKVIKIYNEFGISSLEELEEAAREGRLQKVKGLGKALQTKILHGSQCAVSPRANVICTARLSF